MYPSRLSIYRAAAPIILANASVPLLGIFDTAILGHFGSTQELAGLAVSAMLFNLVFWLFGFLRMSTSGLVSQSQNHDITQIVFLRSLFVASLCSITILLAQWPIKSLAFQLFQATPIVEMHAKNYFDIRVLGAPATFYLYCLFGYLIGSGKTKLLLIFQIILNGLNAILNYVFAVTFELGLSGIAIATVISELSIVIFSLILFRHSLFKFSIPFIVLLREVLRLEEVKNLLSSNKDILIRTFFLLLGFFWFTNQSAKLGDEFLAANQILLSIISFSAFFLDGFAFVAEAKLGKYFVQKKKTEFRKIVSQTTEASAITALCLAVTFLFFSQSITQGITNKPEVLDIVDHFSLYAAAYVFVSFAAFQLDGIFIATMQTSALRNSSFASFTLFIAAYFGLSYIAPQSGLWISFIGYVLFRAVTLYMYYPKIIESLRR